MGWLFYHRPKGESDRQHFQQKLSTDDEIIECATKNFVFYAAVRTESTAEVWALVILIRRTRGELNFGYKDMTETMGPAVADAPASVLDALTPTDNEYALEWRQRCRDNLAARTPAQKRLRAVTQGVVIQLATSLQFRNGLSASRFECIERSGRTMLWHAITDDGARFACRLVANWAERYRWEIVPAQSPATSGPRVRAASQGRSC